MNTKVCLTYIVSKIVGGHETGLDSAESWLIEGPINEVVLYFRKKMRKAHIQGLAYGFAQACIQFAYAACFMLGGFLVSEKGLYYEDMFK